MKTRLLLTLFTITALAALWVINCSGPAPAVVEVRLQEPEQPGAAYVVEAVIENKGRGEGEVKVLFRLRDKETGRMFEKDETVLLRGDERISAAVEIHAPLAEYEAQADAQYPVGWD